MANKICKIVYFDEDSITDYVQIVAGGSLETTTELLKSSEANEKQEVGVNAKLVEFSKHLLDGKHLLMEKFQQDWH